jgi:hypothetical protein
MIFGVCLTGCTEEAEQSSHEAIAEGVICSVYYDIGDGKTGGLTRLNSPEFVPGKNGSWNVDAYGRLYENYLVITQPENTGLGQKIVPAHRLIYVQFGDGGIGQVADRPSLD